MELRAGADSREQLWVEPTTAAPKAKVATERVSRSNNKMVSTFKWISWLPDFLKNIKKGLTIMQQAVKELRLARASAVDTRGEPMFKVPLDYYMTHVP